MLNMVLRDPMKNKKAFTWGCMGEFPGLFWDKSSNAMWDYSIKGFSFCKIVKWDEKKSLDSKVSDIE